MKNIAVADEIQGIDFTNWLKTTVSERDFVVMKMDVEGTEFSIWFRVWYWQEQFVLIDEIFLECQYKDGKDGTLFRGVPSFKRLMANAWPIFFS